MLLQRCWDLQEGSAGERQPSLTVTAVRHVYDRTWSSRHGALQVSPPAPGALALPACGCAASPSVCGITTTSMASGGAAAAAAVATAPCAAAEVASVAEAEGPARAPLPVRGGTVESTAVTTPWTSSSGPAGENSRLSARRGRESSNTDLDMPEKDLACHELDVHLVVSVVHPFPMLSVVHPFPMLAFPARPHGLPDKVGDAAKPLLPAGKTYPPPVPARRRPAAAGATRPPPGGRPAAAAAAGTGRRPTAAPPPPAPRAAPRPPPSGSPAAPRRGPPPAAAGSNCQTISQTLVTGLQSTSECSADVIAGHSPGGAVDRWRRAGRLMTCSNPGSGMTWT